VNVKGQTNGVDLNLTFDESSQRINEKLRVILQVQMLERFVTPTFEVKSLY